MSLSVEGLLAALEVLHKDQPETGVRINYSEKLKEFNQKLNAFIQSLVILKDKESGDMASRAAQYNKARTSLKPLLTELTNVVRLVCGSNSQAKEFFRDLLNCFNSETKPQSEMLMQFSNLIVSYYLVETKEQKIVLTDFVKFLEERTKPKPPSTATAAATAATYPTRERESGMQLSGVPGSMGGHILSTTLPGTLFEYFNPFNRDEVNKMGKLKGEWFTDALREYKQQVLQTMRQTSTFPINGYYIDSIQSRLIPTPFDSEKIRIMKSLAILLEDEANAMNISTVADARIYLANLMSQPLGIEAIRLLSWGDDLTMGRARYNEICNELFAISSEDVLSSAAAASSASAASSSATVNSDPSTDDESDDEDSTAGLQDSVKRLGM